MSDLQQSINPARLTFARQRRGLTKTRLAKALGVEARTVTAWESGEFSPEAQRLEVLGRALNFPVAFFYEVDDLDTLDSDCASFRSMSKMTAGQKHMALSCGAIALLFNSWLDTRFELPIAKLPDMYGASPEAAAAALRQDWQIGQLPIKNVIHLLESKGVRVFSLAVDTMTVDAFSFWRDSTPFVFLNTRKSAERSRFDAAHELGHLVLHKHGAPSGQDAERQADQFASEFLMPRGSLIASAPKFPTLENLMPHKRKWGVSLAALVYSLHTAGVISDWHYRTLYMEIAKRGYRKLEPEGMARETSQVLSKVLAALREDGLTKSDLARALCVAPEEIEELVFGLAMTGVAGGRAGGSPGTARGGHLRVVK